MRRITARELKESLDRHEDLVLVHVLSEEAFQEEHIPGSHNAPVERGDFVRRVGDLAGGKGRRVIVYCARKDCRASPTAARDLVDAGFRDVVEFPGGIAEWKEAGYDLAIGEPDL